MEEDRLSLRNLGFYTNQDRGPAPKPVRPGEVRRGRATDDLRRPEAGEPNRRAALAKLGGAMAALYAGPSALQYVTGSSIRFYTEFRERDPLRFWEFFEGSRLSVEAEGKRMAARPQGVNLLAPSSGLDDGEVTFRLAAGMGPASFVLRAADDKNGYWVNLERQPGRTALKVWRKRKSRWIPVAHHAESDGRNLMYREPWVRFRLDGKHFTASLLQEAPGGVLDELAPRVFSPQARVLHHWTDGNIRRGAVGLAGPAAASSFRVYSILVTNQPQLEEAKTKA